MILGQIFLNYPFYFGGRQHDRDSGYAPGVEVTSSSSFIYTDMMDLQIY